jgi:hypothetical protein
MRVHLLHWEEGDDLAGLVRACEVGREGGGSFHRPLVRVAAVSRPPPEVDYCTWMLRARTKSRHFALSAAK